MHDILPADQVWWERIDKTARELADFYNFQRIETPILEQVSLFERTVGGDTDIVQKEMYTLKTKGGDFLALRPEGTAPVMRAYLDHGLGSLGQPQKFFYQGPFFRHENPQAGRFRQFYQIGFEIIGGVNDPIYDAQVILIFDRLLKGLKIKNTILKVNSIGCKICRPNYKRQLANYYKRYEKDLCNNCLRRLKVNPLRLLDCKNQNCQPFKEKAPNLFDKICTSCGRHLRAVLEYLDELEIVYELDNTLVRGLDYYSQTVFEFYATDSNIGALPGGGRYDYLAEFLGSKATAAVGGATGVERLIEVMKTQEVKWPSRTPRKVFLVHVGDLAKKKSLKIVEELRSAGIPVGEALGKESVKAQLKQADKQGSVLAIIFGQKEIFEESVIIRDLRTGLQESVILSKMVFEIQKRLKERPVENK
ncbi:MAG: histidine--tRNA ligase [Candidatus Liptonbacteria bacterium]|nr:histidine--tRNA ligase [Candidatus Liptonbacteria bacterium]